MKPTAIVLHGPTSAGKSSLASALQDDSEVPGFHISFDAFVEMSRRRDMRSEEELNQALRLHHLNMQSVLKRVAASHFEIILDLVLRDAATLEECISALAPRRTYVIDPHGWFPGLAVFNKSAEASTSEPRLSIDK